MLITDILFEDLAQQKQERANFVKNKLGPRLVDNPDINDIDQFLEQLKKADPTDKGVYMQWIAKLIAVDPQNNRVEDLGRVKKDLQAFVQFKSKIENKDINAYKTFHDLYAVTEPFTNPKKKSKEQKDAERAAKRIEKYKSQIQTVYNGPEGWIRIPETKAAAKFLGQGTRWCTSATNNNMFDHYASSDSLFIIYDKQTKERHQLHIKSGQYADTADKMVGMNSVPEWARLPIVEWYKANGSDISFKQALTLASFGADAADLNLDQDQSDLMNLMSQYGV